MLKKIIVCFFILILTSSIFYHKTFIRLYQGFQLGQISKERAKSYTLDKDLQIQDITQKLILDKSIPSELKQPLIKGERRIVIFKYLSDSNKVAGYYSYIPKGNHPTIVFLRGGNQFFGIMRPNNKFSFINGYNIVGTLYRGNIYGGEDQFGGDDINDVENLIRFFPELERFTNTKLQSSFSMMGVSRGAMEMFIALSKSPYLKSKVKCAISVSGNLDLHVSMNKRSEMKYMFQKMSKRQHTKNIEDWLKTRDPVLNARNLSKSLKVLLIYGLADNRVDFEEQYNFKQALDKEGITSQLVTIPGGNHGLDNCYDNLEKTVLKFIQQ